MSTYMSAADVLLLTSDTEGTPGSVLEAGAMGLPVVATRVGGVQECVLDGDTGLLAPPQDEALLAESVTSLLRDSEHRRVLGERAKKHVAQGFSIGDVATRYEDFYRQVTALRAARPL